MRPQTRAWLLDLPKAERRTALAGRLLRWLGCYLGLRALTLAAGRLGLMSEAAFGAIDLFLLSLLPAFAAFPARRRLAERALLAVDSGRLLEALQAARGRAAQPLVDAEADAHFAELSLMARPKARVAASPKAFALVGAALLIAYQLVLLAAGENARLSYAPPERGRPPIRQVADEARFETPEEAVLGAEALGDEGRASAPGAEARSPSSMSNEEAARLLRERLERREGEPSGGGAAAEDGQSEPPADATRGEARASGPGAASGDQGAGLEGARGEDGSGAQSDGESDADEGKGEASASGAAAGAAGWEGAGRSLEPSPLLDYKARFERLYRERTGERLNALGSGASLSPEQAAEALRRAYASLALNLVLEADEDPVSRSLRDSWRSLREAAR